MPKLHYVSEFYLKGFTDPDIPAGHDPAIWIPPVWVMEKLGGTWKRRAPENVATASDYYVFTDRQRKRRTEVEDFLGLTETAASRILKRKIFKHRLLRRHERSELAGFVVAMQSRVPVEVENARAFLKETGRVALTALLERFKADPQSIEVIRERIRRETGKEIGEIKPEDLDPEAYKVDVDPGVAAAGALTAIGEVSALVAAMGWTFYSTADPHFFVTSDHPVGVIDPVTGQHPVGLHPRHFPHVELTIPLSRTVALAAGWTNYDSARFIPASPEIVEEVNIRTAMAANTLFAPKTSFPGDKYLFTGDDCWALAKSPAPNVISIPTSEGYLLGLQQPRGWHPRKTMIRLTGD